MKILHKSKGKWVATATVAATMLFAPLTNSFLVAQSDIDIAVSKEDLTTEEGLSSFEGKEDLLKDTDLNEYIQETEEKEIKEEANTVDEVKAEIKKQNQLELKAYVIQPGDTLKAIAEAINVEEFELRDVNNLKDENEPLVIGDILINIFDNLAKTSYSNAASESNAPVASVVHKATSANQVDQAASSTTDKNEKTLENLSPVKPAKELGSLTPSTPEHSESPDQEQASEELGTPSKEEEGRPSSEAEKPSENTETTEESKPVKPSEDKKETTEESKPVEPSEDKKTTEESKPVEPSKEDKKTTEESKPVEPSKEDKKTTDESKPVEPSKEDKKTTDESKPVEPSKEDKKTTEEDKPVTPSEEDKKTTEEDKPVTPSEDEKETTEESKPVEPSEEDKKTTEEDKPVTPSEEDKKTTEEDKPVTPSEDEKETTEESKPVEPSEEDKKTTEEDKPVEPSEEDKKTTEEDKPVEPSEEDKKTTEEDKPALPSEEDPKPEDPKPAVPDRYEHGMNMSLVERLIFQYTNDYRVKHQLNPLKKAASWIVKGNQQRAKEMADYGYLRYVDPETGKQKDHCRPDGSRYYTAFEYYGTAENIQQAYLPESKNEEEFAQRIFNIWEQSPGHRANMLDETLGSLDVSVYSIDRVKENTGYDQTVGYYTYAIATQAFGGINSFVPTTEEEEQNSTQPSTPGNLDGVYTPEDFTDPEDNTVTDNTPDSVESTVEVESTTQP
ncbi:CAP domain-containing protein [Facklamia hominis]|uniref:CAP domain-containing protein n=1 Tax=Facklamia hominis TaxID=178214 RepID=UPI0015E09FA0|nr:CAP domain-containing protein [Facklamia hominis]